MEPEGLTAILNHTQRGYINNYNFFSVYPRLTVWHLHMVIALHGLMGTPNCYL